MAKDNNKQGGKKDPKKDPKKDKNKKNKASAGLYDPTKPLTGRFMKKAAGKLAKLEAKPLLHELKQQDKAWKGQGKLLLKNVGNTYENLGKQGQRGAEYQDAVGDELLNDLARISAQSQADISRAGQEGQSYIDNDALITGIAGGGNALAAEMARQAARTAENAQTGQGQAARQAASYETLANSLGQASRLQGGELLDQLSRQLAGMKHDINQDRQSVQRERGLAKTKYLLDLRDQEGQLSLAKRGLGLDEDTLAANVKGEKKDRKLEKLKAELAAADNAKDRRIAQERVDEYRRHNKETEKNAGKDGGKEGGKTNAEKRSFSDAVERAKQLVEDHPDASDSDIIYSMTHPSKQDINKLGVEDVDARTAREALKKIRKKQKRNREGVSSAGGGIGEGLADEGN